MERTRKSNGQCDDIIRPVFRRAYDKTYHTPLHLERNPSKESSRRKWINKGMESFSFCCFCFIKNIFRAILVSPVLQYIYIYFFFQ